MTSIAVLRERLAGETRVALSPDSVRTLVRGGFHIAVESGAGLAAGWDDGAYREAGAAVESTVEAVLQNAGILAAVHRPADDVVARLPAGTAVVALWRPLDEPRGLSEPAARGLTAFALELVPRITRAQSMDVLSSMATVAGYRAVLDAAVRFPGMFPLLMTAAGTVPPANVLVLGAGVAGLQAIATARRLGASVEAYDVRPAAGEQVRSLGARFLEVDLGGIETEDAGGYARELTEEAAERGRRLVAEHAKKADVVITTALIPGRRAPLLLTEEAVHGMRPGAVVVDLAAPNGGNCALTSPGAEYVVNGVTLMGPLNPAATVPRDASRLFSRNMASFLQHVFDPGRPGPGFDTADEIVAATLVLEAGRIVNPRVQAALQQSERKP